jgi:polyisoprenoid-binding protein YceI
MRNSTAGRLFAMALLLGAASPAAAETFAIDAAHTTVGFSVRHLFTSVQGRFDEFAGRIEFDPASPAGAKVSGTIQAKSINTNNEKRDTHLRAPDFFDVEKFPTIEFQSTKVESVDPAKNTGKLHGTLTIRGNARPVVLDVAFLGRGKDPWGNDKAGFTATTTIHRKDFGLTWNETLETGGVLVGDEVTITINAEGSAAK